MKQTSRRDTFGAPTERITKNNSGVVSGKKISHKENIYYIV